MKDISSTEIENFHKKIFSWYKKHKRELPWRETKNPYFIHVSEIMLQQTQVSRVIEYFERFLQQAPDVESLAKLDKKTLLELWQGLGYNNRASRLQKTAKELVMNYGSQYPQTQDKLLTLPGIGPYTSSAILAFAYEERIGVVDTNIRRILIHEFNLEETISDKELEKIALQTCPSHNVKEWYNALMDYGALELTARKTKIKSKTKQSKFIGSTRWVRSIILKRVLERGEWTFEEIKEEFRDYKFDLEKIIDTLKKDDLILQEGTKLFLHK